MQIWTEQMKKRFTWENANFTLQSFQGCSSSVNPWDILTQVPKTVIVTKYNKGNNEKAPPLFACHGMSRWEQLKNVSILKPLTASVVWLSEFLATDPEARVRFPALPEKKSSGSGTGSTQPCEYN
jgi:hypothetical protein